MFYPFQLHLNLTTKLIVYFQQRERETKRGCSWGMEFLIAFKISDYHYYIISLRDECMSVCRFIVPTMLPWKRNEKVSYVSLLQNVVKGMMD
jgi:hypothetical protein